MRAGRMITLTFIEFIAFGATCAMLGVIIGLSFPLPAKKEDGKVGLARMRKWVRKHYRY